MTLRPRPSEAPPLLRRFALLTALALGLAGAGIYLVVRHQAIDRAEGQVGFHARFVADSILRHTLRPSDFETPVTGARLAELDELVRSQIFGDGTLRVQLWSAGGVVTYSDEHRLIGQRADAHGREEQAEVLEGGSVLEVSRLNEEQGGAEGDRKVLEAYVPVRFAADAPPAGVFELYQDYAPVDRDIRALVTPIAGVLALGLLGLWIALFPILRRVTAALASHNRRLEEQARTLERTLGERTRAEEARRRSEEQLRQAQKMDAVGQLAGGIAHDFNNLLLAINGYSELALARLGGGGDRAREAIEEVRAAGDRAASLTRQLLAFSRRQVLQPREVGLNQVIDDMSRMLERLLGEHLELELVLDPRAGRVVADPSQVEQVLMNLTLNARDAMPDGGRLRIETGLVESADIDGDLPPGAWTTLVVSDTGAGIAEETMRHIFEPFFTTKQPGEGTGLGLSMVYGIVEQSGGRIAVESAPGRGTSFRIALPAATGEAAPELAEADAEAAPPGNGTVLLVEDDGVVRGFVRQALELSGYAVTEAAGPGEALEHASAREFDLVLTDVVMPEMNGRQLAERVTQLRPHARILFTSGYPRDP
ncbi:MAG: ATP-binding protein, partial [Actinomycetota bacterium]|nr:ATP-binding protein [Actinomycetota bacterium]